MKRPTCSRNALPRSRCGPHRRCARCHRTQWPPERTMALRGTVYRADQSGPWSAREAIESDGSGRIVYEDRTVIGGERYGYRLGASSGGNEEFYGETWITVPSADGLILETPSPNPSAADPTIRFTLRGGLSARM